MLMIRSKLFNIIGVLVRKIEFVICSFISLFKCMIKTVRFAKVVAVWDILLDNPVPPRHKMSFTCCSGISQSKGLLGSEGEST